MRNPDRVYEKPVGHIIMKCISAYDENRNNNFNLLRLCAAVSVVFTHSFALLGLGEENDPIYQLTGINASGYGLATFFIISGFLVTKSLNNRKSLWLFAKARILRLYPALILSLAFCLLIIGATFTTLAISNYLSSPQTLDFLVSNLNMPVIHKTLALPGVFVGNHNPYVNGALWTLAWESIFYIVLAAMGLTKLINYRPLMIVIALSAILLYIFAQGYNLSADAIITGGIGFGALFAAGACMHLYRNRILLGWSLLLGLVAGVLLISSFLNGYLFTTLEYLAMIYVVIALAYLPKGKILLFNRLGDYSYGMYVFHFPIMQSLVQLMKIDSPYLLFAATLAVTTPFAILSWHFIEKRALRLK
ncbi:MAG: acyltransferase [Candidatus Thiodiazotropha sp. (ex Ctena orbiculata)]|nr:acyltransferase [Candidatus Thiodiazotropha taylori]